MPRALQPPVISSIVRNLNQGQKGSPSPPGSAASFSTTSHNLKNESRLEHADNPNDLAEKNKRHGKLELPQREDLPNSELTYANFAERLAALNPERELKRGDIDAAFNHWIGNARTAKKRLAFKPKQQMLLSMEAEAYWARKEQQGEDPVLILGVA